MNTPFRRFLLAAWWNCAAAGLALCPVIPAEFARTAFRPADLDFDADEYRLLAELEAFLAELDR